MSQNLQINAAAKMLPAAQNLYMTLYDCRSTLVVSEAWEPNRVTFDVVLGGERFAKLVIPSIEILRYQECGQLDANQFVYLK